MKCLSSLILCALLSTILHAQKVASIRIDGAINPAAAEFIHSSIERAKEAGATCVIIRLNTPGGLLKSTRVIVSDILESSIPVIVYVAPSGAHAGSAGVFITLAGHIAVMAPGTNIGAAHPVSLEGQQDSVMMEKATNDAAAFIRSIAKKRQRNVAWAEEAVRKSLSITEQEALEKHVIDFVAQNLEELLEKAHGKRVETTSGTVTLETRGASIETYEMGWSEKVLDILSDPNIAYILFMMGVYGLLFELYNPGSILPGIVGVISLIIAFYSFHTLPINYAGLALIVFSVILFVLEIKVVSHGLLSVGGVISLLLGSMMLIRSESALEFIEISWTVIITSVAITSLFFLVVLGLGLRAQTRKATTGSEGLIGETGEAISALNPTGYVRVHGEIWSAKAKKDKISKGDRVRIVELQNLMVIVEKHM
ncbi:MAG: nodulation protein NfeD [Bacteroidota bacterium]